MKLCRRRSLSPAFGILAQVSRRAGGRVACAAVLVASQLGCAMALPSLGARPSQGGSWAYREPSASVSSSSGASSASGGDTGRARSDLTPVERAYWAGIGLGTIGAVTAASGGIAGLVTRRQIDAGYDEGMTRARREDLVDQGHASNIAALTGVGVAVAGFALAAVIYGIEYTRKGRLAAKRRPVTLPEGPAASGASPTGATRPGPASAAKPASATGPASAARPGPASATLPYGLRPVAVLVESR